MDLFNKTFFRFAFGFIGIIMLSVAIIFVVSAVEDKRKQERGGGCPMCSTNK